MAKSEIIECGCESMSAEALSVLQQEDIEVRKDSSGYSFSVNSLDISWNSDDNGGSYDMVIKGHKFWLDCNGNQGLQLDE